MVTIEGTYVDRNGVAAIYGGVEPPWLLIPARAPNVVVMPYPSHHHFNRTDTVGVAEQLLADEPKKGGRGMLAMCAFNDKTAERRSLHAMCVQRPSQCSPGVFGTTNLSVQLRNTVFCVQPKGDTPSRSSVYDSLASGCIPVFFDSPNSAWEKPYESLVPWAEISVTLGSRGVFEHSKTNFVDVLGRRARLLSPSTPQPDPLCRIPADEVLKKRAAIARYAHALQCAFCGCGIIACP